MSNVRVLQEGAKLADNHLVTQIKIEHETAYQKDKTLRQYKNKILGLAQHPERQNKLPTKQRPHVAGSTTVRIAVSPKFPAPEFITVDDVDSFYRVKNYRHPDKRLHHSSTPEIRVKNALKRIIGETQEFGDWGGEKNDLFTDKLNFRGKRRVAAFALKGRATQGPLTPKKMGKNGDQIGRLFLSTATVFFVVYHSKIEESVHEQMRAFAVGKSFSGTRIFYGVVDGDDLSRLNRAYPKEFRS